VRLELGVFFLHVVLVEKWDHGGDMSRRFWIWFVALQGAGLLCLLMSGSALLRGWVGFGPMFLLELVGFLLLLPGSMFVLPFTDLLWRLFPATGGPLSGRAAFIYMPLLSFALVVVLAEMPRGIEAVLRRIRR
jgi:hypothetical protein